MTNFSIIEVTPEHAGQLMSMIAEVAEFSRIKTSMTINRLQDDIKRKAVHGFIAFDGEEVAGMNLFYYAYTTWVGRFIHMENLYVRPQFRRMGLARSLWKRLAQFAHNEGINRMEWFVLNWNKDGLALSETVQSVNLTKSEGWLVFAMDRKAIENFANQ